MVDVSNLYPIIGSRLARLRISNRLLLLLLEMLSQLWPWQIRKPHEQNVLYSGFQSNTSTLSSSVTSSSCPFLQGFPYILVCRQYAESSRCLRQPRAPPEIQCTCFRCIPLHKRHCWNSGTCSEKRWWKPSRDRIPQITSVTPSPTVNHPLPPLPAGAHQHQ